MLHSARLGWALCVLPHSSWPHFLLGDDTRHTILYLQWRLRLPLSSVSAEHSCLSTWVNNNNVTRELFFVVTPCVLVPKEYTSSCATGRSSCDTRGHGPYRPKIHIFPRDTRTHPFLWQKEKRRRKSPSVEGGHVFRLVPITIPLPYFYNDLVVYHYSTIILLIRLPLCEVVCTIAVP